MKGKPLFRNTADQERRWVLVLFACLVTAIGALSSATATPSSAKH
jgi:hypothetical protein